jgi:hypothetical protein
MFKTAARGRGLVHVFVRTLHFLPFILELHGNVFYQPIHGIRGCVGLLL